MRTPCCLAFTLEDKSKGGKEPANSLSLHTSAFLLQEKPSIIHLTSIMFSGGLGLPIIPLSGWRSKHRPREMDAFEEHGPQLHAKTRKLEPAIIRLSRAMYTGVASHRSTTTSSRSNNIRLTVRSRRKTRDQQSPWDPRGSRSDQDCLIPDDQHAYEMHRTERGRLLARVMGRGRKSNKRD